MKILIADDDPVSSRLLDRLLEAADGGGVGGRPGRLRPVPEPGQPDERLHAGRIRRRSRRRC